jgi:hypothetical protein
MWWTRERVLTGLVGFHRATGQAPTTSRDWASRIRRVGHAKRRQFPTAYAVLRYFRTFRATWTAAGVRLDHAR